VETGALVGERGAFRLTQPLHSRQVPATVQAVLAARIDRLPPDDKRLLQAAAVVGKDVPYALLAAIADLSEEALQAGLARLQAAEFLYETALFPELEYTFKHALTHEVAYGSVLQERRRALHTRIVAAIEALYPGRLHERVELLAHHSQRGELWGKAVIYLRQAGQKAYARWNYREAVEYFELALLAVERLPVGSDTQAQAVDLHLDLRWALFPLGEITRMHGHVQAAERLAAALPDTRRRGRVLSEMASHFWQTGDHARAIAVARRAAADAQEAGDVTTEFVASVRLGMAAYGQGEYRRAAEHLVQTIIVLESAALRAAPGGVEIHSVVSRNFLARCLSQLGRFAEALAAAQEAVTIAAALNRPFTFVDAYTVLGNVHLARGEIAEAIPLLERVLPLSRDSGQARIFPHIAAALGFAQALAGRAHAGVALLEEAVERDTALQMQQEQALRRSSLGETLLIAGRWADAMARALQALESARDHQERGHEAWALRVLGEIAAQADPRQVERAEDYYQQALALADELGMRPLVAHCHLGLGTLYQRVGRDDEAQAELVTAAELYRAMEMAFWLEKAEAGLAQVAS
jgi:tetratricopeptide (TPR) repeat protein